MIDLLVFLAPRVALLDLQIQRDRVRGGRFEATAARLPFDQRAGRDPPGRPGVATRRPTGTGQRARLPDRRAQGDPVWRVRPGRQRGVRHGTRVEHRLFSFISVNWRGRPLTDYQVVVETIAATTTSTALTVEAVLDEGVYPTGL